MESTVLCVSALVFIINGVLVLRRWPSKGHNHPNKHTMAVLVDPLVTALVCPLASDLFFYRDWISGCSATYTTIIMAISLVLYACSFIVCYRLVELAAPPPASSNGRDTSSQGLVTGRNSSSAPPYSSLLVSAFCWSSGLNCLCTWILLSVVQPLLALREDFDPESCKVYFLQDMMLAVFATCLAPQVAYAGLHFCVSRAACTERSRSGDSESKSGDSFHSSSTPLILYTTTVLLCLVSTNILRFIFMTCSCEGLFVMSNSLPAVSLVLSLKLPCATLLQYLWSQRTGRKVFKLES